MTAPEKRLDEAVLGLTARERAILILRPWLAGGEADHRLRKNAPADQKAEVERIENAIGDWNQEFHGAVWATTEWVCQESIQLGFLECLDAFLVRERVLLAAVHADAINLPPLPEPGRWLKRDLPLLFGTRVFEDDEDELVDWPAQRQQFIHGLRQAIELRWNDLTARRLVIAEVEALMGEPMLHRQTQETIDAIGLKLLKMYEALQAFERFALPDPDAERIADMRGWVRWDDLKLTGPTAAPNNGRPWMPPAELAELEALEARLAAELRAKKD